MNDIVKMDLEYQKGVFFIRLQGNLKRKYCHKINNYVLPVLKKHQIKNCIINLQNLEDMEECGIDAILKIKCLMKSYHGHIYLCHVKKDLARKLKRLHIKSTLTERTALKLIEV